MTTTTSSWDKALDIRRVTVWVVRILTYLIYAYIIVVEVFLLLGFILKLFGANPTSGFVDFVYHALDRAMAPFRGIFAPIELGTAGNDVLAVFDTSIVFAMIVYGFVLLLFRLLLDWLTHRLAIIDARKAELDAENAAREAQARAEQARAAQEAAIAAAYAQSSAPAPAPQPAPGTPGPGAPAAPAPGSVPPPPPGSNPPSA